MKILHTSDWHIGQVLHHYDREEEHKDFLRQLAEIARIEQPNTIVVSGDIFHNPAPSASARKLLVDGVLDLHDACPSASIVLTAGNHDSGSRLAADQELWQRAGITVIGGCRRAEDGTFNPADFIIEVPGEGYVAAVPFFHSSNFPLAEADTNRDDRQKEFFKKLMSAVPQDGKPVVLMAHLMVNGADLTGHDSMPVGGLEATNIADFDGEAFDYLALGHIHKPQQVSSRARYCGSPFPMSFSEEYPHTVSIVEIAKRGQVPEVKELRINPLREIITLPNQDGAPFEDALKALSNLDNACTAYVRLLVDQPNPLPADAEDKAYAIARDKACRLCEVKKKASATAAASGDTTHFEDIDDFRVAKPIDIAIESYKLRSKSDEMPQDLIDMLNLAIENVKKNLNI